MDHDMQAARSASQIVLDVGNCARCRENHEGLVFRKLRRPVSSEQTHWATCPTTGEPIILRIMPDNTTRGLPPRKVKVREVYEGPVHKEGG